MKKRLLAVLLTVCMVIMLLPTAAFAADTPASTADELVTAFANAANGDTITLNDDVKVSGTGIWVTGKTVTLDLNHHTLTFDDDSYFGICDAGGLELTGEGTISGGYGTCYIYGSTTDSTSETGGTKPAVTLSVGKDVTISDAAYNVWVQNNGAASYGVKVDIYGTLSGIQPIYVSGNIAATTGTVPEINIHEGAKITGTNYFNDKGKEVGSNAAYLAGYAKTTIEDKATLISESDNVISLAAGELTIEGGTFTSNSTKTGSTGSIGGSITTTTTTAVYIKQHSTTLPVIVDIQDGEFTAAYAVKEEINTENDVTPKPDLIDIKIKGGKFTSQAENAAAVSKESDKAKLAITGGTFTTDPSTYLSDNYVAVESDGSYTVEKLNATNGVAAIGDKGYKTLAAAIADANNDDTIVLLKDFSTGTRITYAGGKTFTLNMNGKTITATNDESVLVVTAGKVTVTGNGTFTGTAASTARGILSAQENGTLIFESGTITANGKYYGITAFGSGKVEVNGGTITAAENAAVSTNGSAAGDANTSGGTSLKITAGTLTGGEMGVYVPAGTFEITGGSISGDTGVAAKGGKLTISGGTITGTGAKQKLEHSDNGWNSTGDALAIESCGYPFSPTSVSITGGEFKSTYANAVASYATEGYTAVKSFITGGIFSSDPSVYCAEGLTGITNTDSSTSDAYPYAVGKAAAGTNPAAVVAGETAADVPDGIERAEELQQSLADAEITGSGLDIAAKNVAQANKEKVTEDVLDELKEQTGATGDEDVTIAVQPYMDIKVTDATTEEDGSVTLSLDIKAMAQKVATTADLTDADSEIVVADGTNKATANAVKVGEPVELKITTPVTITVPLPKNYFGQDVTTINVKHTKSDGKTYIYTGTITPAAEGEDYDILTFTNPHGFSNFKMGVSGPVAKIGDVGYESLQAAVNDAGADDVITVLESGLLATAKKNVNLTGDGVKVVINGITYTVQADKTVTATYNPPKTTYAITISGSEGGKVTASATKAAKGTKVVLTPKAEDGKELDTLTVTDATGAKLDVTKGTDGTYSFTMPAGAVTVKATFKTAAEANCPSKAFTDVDTSKWYHEYVDYALNNGIMEGNGDGTFTPNKNVTRAQLAQILYNLAGKPAVTGKSTFTDVADGAWYSDAVIWAAQQGIVDGYEDGTFHPGAYISRQDLAVMLYRYAGKPAATQTTLSFTDADKVSGYAKAAVLWANEKGIMEGNDNGTLTPKGYATRAQAAKMVAVYLQSK